MVEVCTGAPSGAGGSDRTRAREAGKGRIGLVFGIAVLVVATFLCVKLIPVKVKFFTFADKVEQKIRRSSWRSFEQAQKETLEYVREEAKATGLPTKKLKVQMPEPVGGEMRVVVDWEVSVDLAVTVYVWRYHLEKRAPMLGRGGSAF
jgi:nucleotide-binding universal stress UspA family protein